MFYGDDGLELVHPADVTPDLANVAVSLRVRPIVTVTLSESEARERLDVGHEPFVFFVSDRGRGNVMYVRNDGHYGLIEAG